MKNIFQIVILIVSLIVMYFICLSGYNSVYAQEVQEDITSEPNRINPLEKVLLEEFEAKRIKSLQEHQQEVNKPQIYHPNEAEIEKIIARQIEAKNILYKDRIFGNTFKGLALSVGPTIDKYELGGKIEISVLIKNFSQEKLKLEHERYYGDIDEFRYALYFQDGNPVPKSELLEEYEAHINKPEFYPSRGSITTQIYEPMRLLNDIIEISRFFKIEKEGIYTLVIMRRITNSWDDGFMISNMTKINIVQKNDE